MPASNSIDLLNQLVSFSSSIVPFIFKLIKIWRVFSFKTSICWLLSLPKWFPVGCICSPLTKFKYSWVFRALQLRPETDLSNHNSARTRTRKPPIFFSLRRPFNSQCEGLSLNDIAAWDDVAAVVVDFDVVARSTQGTLDRPVGCDVIQRRQSSTGDAGVGDARHVDRHQRRRRRRRRHFDGDQQHQVAIGIHVGGSVGFVSP